MVKDISQCAQYNETHDQTCWADRKGPQSCDPVFNPEQCCIQPTKESTYQDAKKDGVAGIPRCPQKAPYMRGSFLLVCRTPDDALHLTNIKSGKPEVVEVTQAQAPAEPEEPSLTRDELADLIRDTELKEHCETSGDPGGPDSPCNPEPVDTTVPTVDDLQEMVDNDEPIPLPQLANYFGSLRNMGEEGALAAVGELRDFANRMNSSDLQLYCSIMEAVYSGNEELAQQLASAEGISLDPNDPVETIQKQYDTGVKKRELTEQEKINLDGMLKEQEILDQEVHHLEPGEING